MKSNHFQIFNKETMQTFTLNIKLKIKFPFHREYFSFILKGFTFKIRLRLTGNMKSKVKNKL